MPEEPSEALIDLLGRLGLAGRGRIRAQRPQVRRLARDLPVFESVWIDGLVRARIVTPFQAAEILAGRGDLLKVGPLVLSARLASPGYADYFTGRHIETGERTRVAVARVRPQSAGQLQEWAERLVAQSKDVDSQHLASVTLAGAEGDRLWLAGPHPDGLSAAQWMVQNGRFPPQAALEIARQTAAGLAVLEAAGLCHGDLAAWNLILSRAGQVVLPHPGVRGLLRPEEGFAQADLLPEAYDYLAPERIAQGAPPSVAGDLYACGCLWWHLLTGRPPRRGGTAHAKLRESQASEIPDVAQFCPDPPHPLAEAISACTRRDSRKRPETMAQLAALLGPPSPAGRFHVARCVTRPGLQPSPWAVSLSAARHSSHTPVWLAAVGACLVTAAAAMWAVQTSRPPLPAANIPAEAAVRLNLTHEGSGRPHHAATEEQTAPTGDAETFPKNRAASADPRTTGEPFATATAYTAGANAPAPLVLDAGPVRLDGLALQAGQRVSGLPGRRSTVVVPSEGLVIATEGVRFERLDFVWQHGGATAAAERAAVIEMRASRAEFHGCSFQAGERQSFPPVAIRWLHPAAGSETQLALPSGRIALNDCVIRGLRAAVDCRTAGAVVVETANVLCLEVGSLVALDHCPEADEPVAVMLERVTLRGAGAVLECNCAETASRPGRIRIAASQCAFAGGTASGLLYFTGPLPPTALLAQIEWTGDGSLLAPDSPVAIWQRPDGQVQALDDAAVSMAGLVRSEIEFAGPAEGGPEASRVLRWQAPLRSADPPGAEPQTLFWPQ